MNKSFASPRRLMGWLLLASLSLSQAPRLYGQGGDPSCPTCQGKGPAGPIAPIPVAPIPVAPSPAPYQSPMNEGPPEFPPPPPATGGAGHAGVPLAMPPQHGHGAVMSGAVEFDDVPVPCVKLKIQAPACAVVGKEMEYRIKVQNTTPIDAHNVTVRMNLPASVKILRASPQVHQREPELQWNLGTIPGWGCHDIVVMIMPLGLADIKNCTRVTFEHGQCVTTKVMALAPEGSADGRVPPGTIPGMDGGFGRPGGASGQGGGFGGLGARADFDVRVFGPAEANVGQETTYKITIFNKTDRPIYKAGVVLEWSNDFDLVKASDDLTQIPGMRAWPKNGLFDEVPANSSRSLELILRTRGEGRLCVKASASASLTLDPRDNKIVNAKDETCTLFRRAIPGMTLEMFDRDDPILKDGLTSYPIMVRNQGKDPIKNLRIKAKVPEMLELGEVRGPVRYRSGLNDKRELWVEFEPLALLSAGETQNYEVFVKGKGQVGEARFRVEMTADELDKGPNGSTRWIVEEESTTLVPDEEMRTRVRETSRKLRERRVTGLVTSGK